MSTGEKIAATVLVICVYLVAHAFLISTGVGKNVLTLIAVAFAAGLINVWRLSFKPETDGTRIKLRK